MSRRVAIPQSCIENQSGTRNIVRILMSGLGLLWKSKFSSIISSLFTLICSLIHSLPTFSVGSIISIDFDPNGKSTATVDNKGRCLISDIDTGHYCFHLDNGNRGGKFIWSSKELFATSLLMTTFSILLKFEYLLDDYARCRWSSSSGNPLLYIKYDEKYLNALDVEKKTLTLKNPVELERFQDLCNLNIHLYYSPPLSLKGITNMRIGSMFAPSMEI